jgi:hypothetical protein
MIAPSEYDDVSIPPALATALRQAAASVPSAEHDLDRVRQRARRRRRRAVAGTGIAAAACLLLGGLGVHRLVSADDAEVIVPTSVSGWERSGQSQTLLVPRSMPNGWTLAWLDTEPFPDQGSGPTTSQLFAVDGQPPLRRGFVVSSQAADDAEGLQATHTVRGQPATMDQEPGIPLVGSWIEDGVNHEFTAVGMNEAELMSALESLVPHEDPTTGFAAPTGAALPELDAVTTSEPSASAIGYSGPHGQEIEVTAESPGAGTVINRLVGEPLGDGLIRRHPDPDYPWVSRGRPDGWTVTVAVAAGSPDPALLDAVADSVERSTLGQFIESDAAGEMTTLAAVDNMTIEVHGRDDHDLVMCLVPAPGRPVCEGASDYDDYGFTTGSFLVDGDWIMVTITDGDEPGHVLVEPEDGWDEHSMDADLGGDPLDGEQVRSDGRTIEVVTVPDDIDDVTVMSPMTENGAAGNGQSRPD